MQEGLRSSPGLYCDSCCRCVLRHDQPNYQEGLQPLDALYFVIVKIVTVGSGDISPYMVPNKVITLAIIPTGVDCFVAVAANAIEYFIAGRECTERMRNMNMLVGVFSSEAGTSLLRMFSADPAIDEIWDALVISGVVNRFLSQNKHLVLAMLENPYLIDHNTFTELMQALFHVTEKPRVCERVVDLPETDYVHLSGDINRVYSLLIWENCSAYMQHMNVNYPNLFSLAMRTNPFDAHASPIVT
jgi:voltage-gated potassium channel